MAVTSSWWKYSQTSDFSFAAYGQVDAFVQKPYFCWKHVSVPSSLSNLSCWQGSFTRITGGTRSWEIPWLSCKLPAVIAPLQVEHETSPVVETCPCRVCSCRGWMHLWLWHQKGTRKCTCTYISILALFLHCNIDEAISLDHTAHVSAVKSNRLRTWNVYTCSVFLLPLYWHISSGLCICRQYGHEIACLMNCTVTMLL